MRKMVLCFLLLSVCLLTSGCSQIPSINDGGQTTTIGQSSSSSVDDSWDISDGHFETGAMPEIITETETADLFKDSDWFSYVPEYSGEPFCIVNNNIPFFRDEEIPAKSFESYPDLDELGRCGVTYACIGVDLMPTEEREGIGQVKPTGWHTIKYDFVDGKYLYNRCHLIGFQLAGENANEKNLITGTRYMNVDGMLPFENAVADYVKSTENHVMYSVTPVFIGNDLVARGVLMEALSVEDNGRGIKFNVFCYNVQPGVTINYSTGESYESDAEYTTAASVLSSEDITYIINKNTRKFHKPTCVNVSDMKPQNRKETTLTYEELLNSGYSPCKSCN